MDIDNHFQEINIVKTNIAANSPINSLSIETGKEGSMGEWNLQRLSNLILGNMLTFYLIEIVLALLTSDRWISVFPYFFLSISYLYEVHTIMNWSQGRWEWG